MITFRRGAPSLIVGVCSAWCSGMNQARLSPSLRVTCPSVLSLLFKCISSLSLRKKIFLVPSGNLCAVWNYFSRMQWQSILQKKIRKKKTSNKYLLQTRVEEHSADPCIHNLYLDSFFLYSSLHLLLSKQNFVSEQITVVKIQPSKKKRAVSCFNLTRHFIWSIKYSQAARLLKRHGDIIIEIQNLQSAAYYVLWRCIIYVP